MVFKGDAAHFFPIVCGVICNCIGTPCFYPAAEADGVLSRCFLRYFYGHPGGGRFFLVRKEIGQRGKNKESTWDSLGWFRLQVYYPA
jgi:hypothetical protein